MKTIIILSTIAILLILAHSFKTREPFLVDLIYSPFKPNIFGSYHILVDPESPYKEYTGPGGPQLSGQTNIQVAIEYAPHYNNSDVAKELRGWTLPTEGNCVPNELCGKFYDKFILK